MNVQKIRAFIETHRPDSVGIFSFAIWDDKDHVDFGKWGIKSAIENALGIELTEILTVPQICKEVFWKQGVVMEVNEFITIWGKQRAFIDWCLLTQQGHAMLIDDVVQNITVIDNDRQLRIDTLNVNKI